jgi:hypothetical protein
MDLEESRGFSLSLFFLVLFKRDRAASFGLPLGTLRACLGGAGLGVMRQRRCRHVVSAHRASLAGGIRKGGSNHHRPSGWHIKPPHVSRAPDVPRRGGRVQSQLSWRRYWRAVSHSSVLTCRWGNSAAIAHKLRVGSAPRMA